MDQIADLLTRIKNASAVNRSEVQVSYSKMKEAILGILKNEGFLSDFTTEEEEGKKYLKLTISQTKVLVHIKRVSKPGRRIYVKNQEIPKPLRGLGTTIVSTSKGVVTGREAAKQGLGGELICEIW